MQVDNPNSPTPENIPAPAEPIIARTVLDGERSEREIQLQAELDAEKNKTAELEKGKKNAELDAMKFRDEAIQLKKIQEALPNPAPVKSKNITLFR